MKTGAFAVTFAIGFYLCLAFLAPDLSRVSAEAAALSGDQIKKQLGGKHFRYCGRRSGSMELLNNGKSRAFDSRYGQMNGRWSVKGNKLCREWSVSASLANCTGITALGKDDFVTDRGGKIFAYSKGPQAAKCRRAAGSVRPAADAQSAQVRDQVMSRIDRLKTKPLPQSSALVMLRQERSKLLSKPKTRKSKASSKRLKRTKKRSIKARGKGKRIVVGDDLKSVTSSIGILYFQVGGTCTAFCVAPDLVVTSAHCFYDHKSGKKKKGLAFSRFFLPNRSARSDRSYYQRYKLKRIFGNKRSYIKGGNSEEAAFNVVLGYQRYIRSIARFKTDWALVRLAEPICQSQLQVTSMARKKLISAEKRGELMMVGYHGDRFRDGMLLSPKCKFLDRKITRASRKMLRNRVGLGSQTMLHSCRAAPGSSGSPILVRTKDKFQVVAINAGNVSWHRWRKKSRRARKRITGRWSENISVLTKPLQPLIDRLKTEKLLTSEDEYRQLQTALNKAGYNVGGVDGVLGPRSKRGIKRFEKKTGKAQTGLPTRELLSALEAAAK